MSQQAHTAAVPITARSNGRALLFGVGAYVAMIPVAFTLACVAAFGI